MIADTRLLIDAAEILSEKYVIRSEVSISTALENHFNHEKNVRIIKPKRQTSLCRARNRTSEAKSLTRSKIGTFKESSEDWYFRSRNG